MPTAKKPSATRTKKTPVKLATKKSQSIKIKNITISQRLISLPVIAMAVSGAKDLMRRRPHRSFRHTYRRDYIRPLNLPGYWAFTNYVRKTLWSNKLLMLRLVTIYALVAVVTAGFASQDVYLQARDLLNVTGQDTFSGVWGEVGKAGMLLASGATGAFNSVSTDNEAAQQIFAGFAAILLWLTTVWLLRAILTGNRPKLRDGLYNAGAPLLSTFIVGSVIIVQLVPLAVAFFAYGAASVSGLLSEGGALSMLFWAVATLLVVLSAYWLTSTLIALVVVTLPGMYPLQALRTAGDLVIGRRIRILLRMLWMMLVVVLFWAVIAIPAIIFDGWLKGVFPMINWLPIVPVLLLVLSSSTVVWVASYIYLLYRRIVEDDALPA
jgi:hypothetical protein